MKTQAGNQNNGLVSLILIIVVALFLMKYLGVTVSDIIVWLKALINWFRATFADVLK